MNEGRGGIEWRERFFHGVRDTVVNVWIGQWDWKLGLYLCLRLVVDWTNRKVRNKSSFRNGFIVACHVFVTCYCQIYTSSDWSLFLFLSMIQNKVNKCVLNFNFRTSVLRYKPEYKIIFRKNYPFFLLFVFFKKKIRSICVSLSSPNFSHKFT